MDKEFLLRNAVIGGYRKKDVENYIDQLVIQNARLEEKYKKELSLLEKAAPKPPELKSDGAERPPEVKPEEPREPGLREMVKEEVRKEIGRQSCDEEVYDLKRKLKRMTEETRSQKKEIERLRSQLEFAERVLTNRKG